MVNRNARVAGESAAVVLAAFADRTVQPARDGMAQIAFSVRPDSAEGKALARAYSRMVGRLAARDVLEELETGVRPRTEGQRKADALVQLIREAADAFAAAPEPPPASASVAFHRVPPRREEPEAS